MNKLILAALLALGLGKIASIDKDWINTKLAYYSNDKEVFELLQTLNLFYEKFDLYSLQAYQFIPIMKNMEDSVLILNFLLTYTPIFFIILFLIFLPFKRFKKRKNPGNELPEKIKAYIDYKLEIEFQKRVQKEVHKELLRLQQSKARKQNKVA